jgi:hypothetical protein
MSRIEDLKKIEAILQRGVDNFKAGKPFPEDVVSQGTFDTLREIAEVDPFIGDLMHRLMDHETASTCDDLPYTDEQYNEATEDWLEGMLEMVKVQIQQL